MEKKLLELLQLANTLNQQQNNVYAQITYHADDNKILEIYIRSKQDFTFIEKCEIMLKNAPISKLNDILKLFKRYIGGVYSE